MSQNMIWYLLLSILLVYSTISSHCSSQEHSECLCLQDMVPENELRTTMRLKPFPDGTGRLLAAESIGVLWIYSANFSRHPEPFANFTERMVIGEPAPSAFQGFALHPNFPVDGRVFVNFHQADENGDFCTLRQYNVFPDNQQLVDIDSEVVLIERQKKSNGTTWHSGGEVLFSLDGYLYVAYGDGYQGDPLYLAQNRGEFSGKILRLDVDNVPEGKTYGIPPDNPFIDEEGTLSEIYALGFKHPWTVNVDTGDPVTGENAGRMFVADCGQRSWEEIDLVVKGGNYGWSSREGNACYRYRYCGQIGPEELPIASYSHEGAEESARCAVGGGVYRGSMNPGLQGLYIHGDTGVNSSVFVVKDVGSGQWTHNALPFCYQETCAALGMTNAFNRFLTGFGTDSNSEMYLISSTNRFREYGARIQRLIDPATFSCQHVCN